MRTYPIIKKDMAVRSRSRTLAAVITVFNAVLFVVGIMGSFSVIAGMRESLKPDYGTTLRIYCLTVMLEYIIVMLISPVFTVGSISGERAAGTLDLLLVTNETPLRIITGKLISAMIPVSVIIVSGLPAMILPVVFGGVGMYEILKLLLIFIPMSLFMLCIGMFASSLTRTVIHSTAICYGIVFFLLAGTVLIPLLTARITPYEENSMAYLLMLNPLFPIADMLSKQIGETGFVLDILKSLNLVPKAAYLGNTLIISMLYMLPLMAFLFLLSILNITPGKSLLKNIE